MALRSQRQVLGHLERMNRKAVRRMVGRYRDGVIGPLLEAVESAEDAEDAKRSLGGELLRRMDLDAVGEAAAGAMVQSALIGRTTAVHRDKKLETGN